MKRQTLLMPFVWVLCAAGVALSPAAAQRRKSPPLLPSTKIPERVKRGPADVPTSPTRSGDPAQLNPQPLPPDPRPDPLGAKPLPRD